MPAPTKAQLAEYTRLTGLDFYTDKPPAKPETAVQGLARVKAEDELKKRANPDPVEKDTEVKNIKIENIEATNKLRDLQKPKKGRTLEEVSTSLGERSKKTLGLISDIKDEKTKQVEKQLEDEGLYGETATEENQLKPKREKRRKELQKESGLLRVLKLSNASLEDTARFVGNIKTKPEVFGKNPDVDQIFTTVNKFEDTLNNYNAQIDDFTYRFATLAVEKGVPRENAERMARNRAKAHIPLESDHSLEYMQEYISMVKGK